MMPGAVDRVLQLEQTAVGLVDPPAAVAHDSSAVMNVPHGVQ